MKVSGINQPWCNTSVIPALKKHEAGRSQGQASLDYACLKNVKKKSLKRKMCGISKKKNGNLVLSKASYMLTNHAPGLIL